MLPRRSSVIRLMGLWVTTAFMLVCLALSLWTTFAVLQARVLLVISVLGLTLWLARKRRPWEFIAALILAHVIIVAIFALLFGDHAVPTLERVLKGVALSTAGFNVLITGPFILFLVALKVLLDIYRASSLGAFGSSAVTAAVCIFVGLISVAGYDAKRTFIDGIGSEEERTRFTVNQKTRSTVEIIRQSQSGEKAASIGEFDSVSGEIGSHYFPASVSKNGEHYCVDWRGQRLTRLRVQELLDDCHRELIRARWEGRIGLIDETGSVKVSADYDWISPPQYTGRADFLRRFVGVKQGEIWAIDATFAETSALSLWRTTPKLGIRDVKQYKVLGGVDPDPPLGEASDLLDNSRSDGNPYFKFPGIRLVKNGFIGLLDFKTFKWYVSPDRRYTVLTRMGLSRMLDLSPRYRGFLGGCRDGNWDVIGVTSLSELVKLGAFRQECDPKLAEPQSRVIVTSDTSQDSRSAKLNLCIEKVPHSAEHRTKLGCFVSSETDVVSKRSTPWESVAESQARERLKGKKGASGWSIEDLK